MLGAGTLGILAATSPQDSPPPTRAPAATARASQPPPLPSPPAVASYRDFVFETDVITAPTATKTQSKLWYSHGTWWGALFQPSTNQLNVFRLDWDRQQWIDTGTLVDERSTADPDVLWTGEHLYVLSAGPHDRSQDAARVLRFSYDASIERFTLDPNFPVLVSETGVEAAVISQAADGRLWATYTAGNQVWTVHSLEHDAHWSEPAPLPHAGARVAPDDVSAIAAFGPGRVGVMWSNQLEGRVYFTSRADGDPLDAWSEPEIVLEGDAYADDHVNLKTYRDGDRIELLAALKTSLDTRQPKNPLDPQILLAVRADDGSWTTHMVSQVRDRQSRAIVSIDEAARMVYVAATSNDGTIAYKRASLDAIAFETGPGDPLVVSTVDTRIGNASSTKQPITAESGGVVIASDDGTGRYLHGVLDLGGGLPPARPDDPDRPNLPAPPDLLTPVPLVYADFEPWPVGPPAGTAWTVRDEDPADALRIVADGSGGRALRVRAARTGAPVRACRRFAERPEGVVSFDVRVSLRGGPGASDTSLLSFRGSGGEAVSLRVTADGDLAWFDGPTKAQSEVVVQPGAIYRIRGTIDQARRTFSFRIHEGGREVLSAEAVAWRMDEVRIARDICMETAAGRPDQAVDVLDVKVMEEPPG